MRTPLNDSEISQRSIEFSRHGAVSKVLILFVASMFLVVTLACLAMKIRPDAHYSSQQRTTVRVYCASAVVRPVELVIADYNRSSNAKVEIVRTGGSGELAGQIKMEFESGLADAADIYLSADDSLLAMAQIEGIITEQFPIASQNPIIAIAADSNLEINNLRELIQLKNIRYGIASEHAAIGKIVRNIAAREGLLAALESNKSTDSENVMTLAQALVAGSLDAAVIWDSTVLQINQLQINQMQSHPANQISQKPLLKISALADSSNEFHGNIAVGMVATTKTPTECLKFIRFLTTSENSKSVFEQAGFIYTAGAR